jgi:methionyl-tRNA formyltransferase
MSRKLKKHKVLFMGTPEFAVITLEALIASPEYDVVAVATRADKPAGRGRKLRPSPVKEMALEHGIPVFQPRSLRKDPDAVAALAATEPDVIVVAAYGLILPKSVLEIPRHGCINVHASLLPRWRGAAPIAAAILAGDEVTGITIMLMDEGMDTGPILAQAREPIRPTDTTGSLSERLATLGARLLMETLPRWIAGEIESLPQDDSRATRAPMIRKGQGRIDWHKPADVLEREVRAYQPWPGSFTSWRGKNLKVLEAGVSRDMAEGEPGTVVQVEDGVGAVTGNGVLLLRRLQLAGKKPVEAASFLRGYRDFVGSVLGK